MNYIEVYFQSVLQNSYKIERDTYIIGRSEDADIRLNNKGVSSIHAVIQCKNNKLSIKDLNSTNSTLLNDKKVTGEQALHIGDTLIISKYVLKINDWAAKASTTRENRNVQLDENDPTIIAQLSENFKKNNKPSNCYLHVIGDKNQLGKMLLSKPSYSIGAGIHNDIQIPGWVFFTPKHIAEIKRIGDVYYIIPLKKSYISVNGRLLNQSLRLSDNDKIKIKKVSLNFISEII